MKCILLLTVIAVGCLGAVEITVLTGGNRQEEITYLPYWDEKDRGISFHGGILAGFNFTPPTASLRLGMETGIVYHYSLYMGNPEGDIHVDGRDFSFTARINHSYQNLCFPLNLRTEYHLSDNMRIGLGTGIIYRLPLRGRDWNEIIEWTGKYPESWTYDIELAQDQLISAFGWQIKTDMKFRLYKDIWIKPAFTAVVYPDLEYEYYGHEDFGIRSLPNTYLASLGLDYEM